MKIVKRQSMLDGTSSQDLLSVQSLIGNASLPSRSSLCFPWFSAFPCPDLICLHPSSHLLSFLLVFFFLFHVLTRTILSTSSPLHFSRLLFLFSFFFRFIFFVLTLTFVSTLSFLNPSIFLCFHLLSHFASFSMF